MLDIRKALKKSGITQRELANRLGKTPMSIYYMLHNQSTSIKTLYKIADVLNVSVLELFTEYEEQ